MKKICVITGGTSGIGKATARYISEKNYKVYEISRHAPQSNECEHVTADVTDAVAVKQAVDLIVSREGRIDLLVNSAGSEFQVLPNSLILKTRKVSLM